MTSTEGDESAASGHVHDPFLADRCGGCAALAKAASGDVEAALCAICGIGVEGGVEVHHVCAIHAIDDAAIRAAWLDVERAMLHTLEGHAKCKPIECSVARLAEAER